MRPIPFPESNGVLGAPEGTSECDPLPIFRTGEAIISKWELNAEEMAEIAKTGLIYVWVHSPVTQPPISLSTSSPFVKEPS
jgi:hypothetical protein